MRYQSGYKHRAYDTELAHVRIYPKEDVVTPFICLSKDGVLVISSGYAWDGATWFPDIKSVMRGSLIHDAIYQLIRDGYLDPKWRDAGDKELMNACIDDGMFSWLAGLVFKGVQKFGKSSTMKVNVRPVLTAP